MRPFSLLTKPASADCNLNCTYCFYLDHCKLYPETVRHRMSDEVLETLIKSYMSTIQPQYGFGWQGGEPTMMGFDFFQKMVNLQKKHGKSGMQVSNGLQTNATLITEDMAKLFSDYHFLLGVSVDGPEDVHNVYRTNRSGKGSYAQVMKGIELLKKNNVEFNILTLVSQSNVHRASEIYHYLVDNGFYYHQYIPCCEFDADGNKLPFAITGDEWGNFLNTIYDEWYQKDTRKVSVRFFDSLLTKLVDNQYNICHMGRNCCQYFVVEYNGDIYPCDFFVEKDLKLGNIQKNSWKELQESPKYKQFGTQKKQWHNACDTCEYLIFCSGDCLKNRLIGPTPSPENVSWLCSGWKTFFNHSLDGFNKLAEKIRSERLRFQQQQQATFAAQKSIPTIGRNDPCPCGSGKKFKLCHGKK